MNVCPAKASRITSQLLRTPLAIQSRKFYHPTSSAGAAQGGDILCLSRFHNAATGSPIPPGETLPGTLHGKLTQLKEVSKPVTAQVPEHTFRDSLAFFTGWIVIAFGLGLSLHAARSMVYGHREQKGLQEAPLPAASDELLATD